MYCLAAFIHKMALPLLPVWALACLLIAYAPHNNNRNVPEEWIYSCQGSLYSYKKQVQTSRLIQKPRGGNPILKGSLPHFVCKIYT